MNTDFSRGKRGLQFGFDLGFCDLLDESLSFMVDWALLGRFTKSSLFVENDFH